MINWQKNPGGKRYTATVRGVYIEVVRQNTAAGASRWMATAGREYPKLIIGKGDYLSYVKESCESYAASL